MKKLFKRTFALTDQGAQDCIKSSVAAFLSYCINMVPAFLLMLFFDQALLSNNHGDMMFYLACIGYLIIAYIILNFEYNALYNTTYRESENIRIDIARNLSNLPLSYFSKHDLTDLAQTIMEDVSSLEHAMSHAIAKIIGFVVFFILIAIMILKSNFILGLCVLVPILLFYLLIFVSKKVQVKANAKYYQKLRLNSDSFQEAIELQQEIKSFGLSNDIKKKLYREVEEGEKIHIYSEFAGAIITNFAALSLYLAHIFVIVIGTLMLARGEINILYFLGFLLGAVKLKEGAEATAFNIMELFYLDARVARINEIRNAKRQEGEATELTDFDIELKNVSFAYDNETTVLNDVSFVAKQNEVTALVGRSGCGKTSILRLVSRLYDSTGGQVLISGKDIKEISTKSLFEKVSIVFQDVTLFNASVLENIRIGNTNATDEEVKQAARLANCEEFINKLEFGYDTLIGENGASLSGGERQRLSIARAFLKNAPIILLDEISASLDVENEQKIQESLNRLTNNKTVLIISHRLKSIQNVDKIVVIDNGQVESVGNHDELLKHSVIYQDLVHKTALAESFEY